MSRPQAPWPFHLLALLCFALLTGMMTYPLSFQGWNSIENCGDPLLNSRILACDIDSSGDQGQYDWFPLTISDPEGYPT